MKIDEIVPGSIGMILFGGMADYIFNQFRLAFQSRRWPLTTDASPAPKSFRENCGPTASYDIRYEYQVNGLNIILFFIQLFSKIPFTARAAH